MATTFHPGEHGTVSATWWVHGHDHSHCATTEEGHKCIVQAIGYVSIDNPGEVLK